MEWTTLGSGSGYRSNTRENFSHVILARCERRFSQNRHAYFTFRRSQLSIGAFPVIP